MKYLSIINRHITATITLLSLLATGISAQKATITDANTMLHTLKPKYDVPYVLPDSTNISKVANRIYNYLSKVTPTEIINNRTKRTVGFDKIDPNCTLKLGDFRIIGYEWAVVYAAMLKASVTFSDNKYADYALDRLKFIAQGTEAFRELRDSTGYIETCFKSMFDPQELDDYGAMCSAMIKAQLHDPSINLTPLIQKHASKLMFDALRLKDGTISRNRPYYGTVWADDLFMSVPAMANYSTLTQDKRYIDEAVKQVNLFYDKLLVKRTGLMRHGWVADMRSHPSISWARANGWMLMAMAETIDAMDKSHPEREQMLQRFKDFVEAIVGYQSLNGFWHQVIDNDETYDETSATAMFTYCIAHAINEGWIDIRGYSPTAIIAWNALSTKVTANGHVEGTCVGTGMAFDISFYAHRPVTSAAAHGYGVTLLAAAEMYKLVTSLHPRHNDGAIHIYNDENVYSNSEIYNVGDPSRPLDNNPGNSRKGKRPVVFIIGDSTAKNSKGSGDMGMWGWGSFFDEFILSDKASVENHAMGGRSSRTFMTEGLWNKVLSAIKPGDYLIVQFGHNDIGPLGTDRARGTLNGIGYESKNVTLERNGNTETVYTYGHYMRQYIRQAKAKGANVLVMSFTPDNKWINDSTITRCADTFSKWTEEVAQREKVAYIDANALIADKYDKMGRKNVETLMYKDGVHTTYAGAFGNCQIIAKAMLELDTKWSSIVDCQSIDRKPRKRTVFIAGDSTAKTYNTDSTLQRGWGQMIGNYLGDGFAVSNQAQGGRSTKSFIKELRWKKIVDSVRKGDVVLIQFGHNDASTRPERHTTLDQYRQNLMMMVTNIRAKGANPVLVTSIVMRTFDGENLIDDRLKDYPVVMREVARNFNVKIIDANTLSRDLVIRLGNEESKKLYMWIEPGVDHTYPEGKQDDTHTNEMGADEYAKMIADELINILQ